VTQGSLEMPNVALGLRLRGYDQYVYEVFDPKMRRFLGYEVDAEGVLVESRTHDGSVAKLTADLVASFNEITDSYGRLGQLLRYRKSLSYPKLSQEEMCASFRGQIIAGDSTFAGYSEDACDESFDWTMLVVIILGTVAGLMLVLLLGFGVRCAIRRFRKAVAAEVGYEKWQHGQIDDALHQFTKIGFSVCFLPFSSLKETGKLPSHEHSRNAGELTYLDTCDEVIQFVKKHPTAFFSHQWLSKAAPDPENRHFEAVLRAGQALCDEQGIDSDTLYCWVDYSSIPQANDTMKKQSISSIAVYSSVCRFFVAVCPTVMSAQSIGFDVGTYQRRGWCRLEQWARLAVGGLELMYIFDGDALRALSENPSWYQDSMRVLSGEFSDEQDKRRLVPTILALWASVLRNRHHGSDSVGVYELVKFNYSEVFPSTYFGPLLTLLEERIENEFREAAEEEHSQIGSQSEGSSTSDGTDRRIKKRFAKRSDKELYTAFKAATFTVEFTQEHHGVKAATRQGPVGRVDKRSEVQVAIPSVTAD